VLGPLLLIVLGILFLMNNLYPGMFRFGKMWPVILIVIGLAKVAEYFQAPRPPDEVKDEVKDTDKKESQ